MTQSGHDGSLELTYIRRCVSVRIAGASFEGEVATVAKDGITGCVSLVRALGTSLGQSNIR